MNIVANISEIMYIYYMPLVPCLLQTDRWTTVYKVTFDVKYIQLPGSSPPQLEPTIKKCYNTAIYNVSIWYYIVNITRTNGFCANIEKQECNVKVNSQLSS